MNPKPKPKPNPNPKPNPKTDRKRFVKVFAANGVAISAGKAHSFVVKKDGSLWGTGANPNPLKPITLTLTLNPNAEP